MSDRVELPQSLLQAIAAQEGGRVSVIMGAGCSVESPTNLPLSRDCAMSAHRRLIQDGVLQAGDCDDPGDLSQLASVVKRKTGRQSELVMRLPVTEFRNARANEGHKLAVALMLEGAIGNVVTLNFDLAMSNALGTLSAGTNVVQIKGPEEHNQWSATNLIYLHRSAESEHEAWILTVEALEEEWRNNWEELVTNATALVPATVFVGLGSSCGVLRHSVEKIRQGLGESSETYLVSPDLRLDSGFATELKVDEESYIQLGWIDFMRRLSHRFLLEMLARIEEGCLEISKREGWTVAGSHDTVEDVPALAKKLEELGLLPFGMIRASWFLEGVEYLKLENAHIRLVAMLMLSIGYIERKGGATAELKADGSARFDRSGKRPVEVLLIHGGLGNYTWASLEARLLQANYHRRNSRKVLACGIGGTKPDGLTPPESILNGKSKDDIIEHSGGLACWTIEELRADPTLIENGLFV